MSEWIVKSIEHLLDFSNILNASIAASWMVLAVIVLRFLLKKAPRWIHVALWGLVAVRLLLPFSIESSLSLIPSAETIPHELLRVEGVQLQEPAYLDVVSNPIFTNGASVEIGQTIDRVQINMLFMTLIWLTGIAVLLIYTITSYWYLRRKVREAVILRDSIFQSENAGSPFVLGIIKPRIYLPYKIEEQTLVHVIAHEQAHIQRKDHWWKPLGFLLLTIHWFNPLMWLGYVLLCRDIELACDEKVIKDIDNEQRANYSQALVACSVKRPMIAACPLAFGEVGVKERVKTVLNYKKPAFWIIVVAVVACIVIAVCFLTNPKTRFTVPENSIEKVTVFHATVNDGMSRELSPAQISEMVGRFSGINRAKRSEQYAGFTPGYQLCLFMKDGSNIYANGYNFADNSKVEIVYDGKRYAITDDDFSKYLINICAGNDTTEAVMVGNATKWFDCLHGDEMVWDGMREINLDEFPGVTFRAYSERIEAVTDKETVTLYTGMPIWSVFFCDMNGDGKPELCSSTSLGSGLIDNRFIIYDYVNGASYERSDRGLYDYTLNLQDGKLIVEKRGCMQEELAASGELVFRDETYQIIWDKSIEPCAVYLTDYPENEFTSRIPKPANGTIDYVIDDSANGRYAVFFKDITMEQSEAYIKDLKAAGYTNVAGKKEDIAIGEMLQKDDVTLSVACSDGGLGIQIIVGNLDTFTGSVSVVGGVDGPKAVEIKTNETYYSLTDHGKLKVSGSTDSDHSFVQSQMLWTNSTRISVKNNSGTDVMVYLFSVENESTPILEMTLSNKEEKAFTNLSSQYIYYVRISADSSANVSVDISD